MTLSRQELDVVDTLAVFGTMTAPQLAGELLMTGAQLYPLLARLIALGVVSKSVGAGYPGTVTYRLED